MSESLFSAERLLVAIRTKNFPQALAELTLSNVDVNQLHNGKLALVQATSPVGKPMLKPLLKAGAHVDAKDAGGETALMKAATFGKLDLAEILLQAGADPNIQHDQRTALHVAITGASSGQLKVAQALINAGANVNLDFISKAGLVSSTVLMRASRFGSAAAVRLLINSGADVNRETCLGTALTEAAGEGHADVVQVLLEMGANPNYRTPNEPSRLHESAGKTALEIAKQNRKLKAARVLELATGTPPVTQPNPTVAEAWLALESALKSERPHAIEGLRPPATPTNLALLTTTIGQALPPALTTYFSIHDGQTETAVEFIGDDDEFSLLPITAILREWTLLNQLLNSGNFDKEWYHPTWLPLTTNGAGDSHCIDLLPINNGRIIAFNHETGTRPVVADSLAEWLQDIALSIQS